MKPRLKAVRETSEDWDVWLWLAMLARRSRTPYKLSMYGEADRRDADLMHTRTHRMAFFCAVCWENIAHDACTVDNEIRLRRPFHPDSLGALLRDVLK